MRNLVLGLLLAVAGIGVLLLGIYQQWIPVGIVGFLMMGAGGYFATAGGSSQGEAPGQGGNGDNGGGGGGGGPRSSTPTPSGGFMSSLEEKWDQRRNQP